MYLKYVKDQYVLFLILMLVTLHCIFFSESLNMNKQRKNAELPETMEIFKRRNEELEAGKLMLMARIQELETLNKKFEQEILQLKENCKCPQVKKLLVILIKNKQG